MNYFTAKNMVHYQKKKGRFNKIPASQQKSSENYGDGGLYDSSSSFNIYSGEEGELSLKFFHKKSLS